MNWLIFLQIWLVKMAFPQYWLLPSALIYAQAKHETGNFSSNIYKENKNLFGMKKPYKRSTTVKGENRGHATYSSGWSSIYDYFLRQQYFHIDYLSVKQYIERTKQSNYAEDPNYDKHWQVHYDALGVFARVIPYMLIPVVVLVTLYFFRRDLLRDIF
jgi:hypothetical protein